MKKRKKDGSEAKGPNGASMGKAMKMATVVATLGASLGVNVGELLATDPYVDPCLNVKETGVLQGNLVSQVKLLKEQQTQLFNEINTIKSQSYPYPLSKFTVLKARVYTLSDQIKQAIDKDGKVKSQILIDETVLQGLMNRAKSIETRESTEVSPQVKALDEAEARQRLLLDQIKVDQTK